MAEKTDPTAHIADRKRKNRALLNMVKNGRLSKEEAAPFFVKDTAAAAWELKLKEEKESKRLREEEERMSMAIEKAFARRGMGKLGPMGIPCPHTPPVEQDGAESVAEVSEVSEEDQVWGVWGSAPLGSSWHQEEMAAKEKDSVEGQNWWQEWTEKSKAQLASWHEAWGNKNSAALVKEPRRTGAQEEQEAWGPRLTSAGTPQRKGTGKGGSWGEELPLPGGSSCGGGTGGTDKNTYCGGGVPHASLAHYVEDVEQMFTDGYYQRVSFASDIMTIDKGDHVLWKSAGLGKKGGPSTAVKYFHGMCQGWRDDWTVIVC
jgi:hypothetical protein